jgi:DNA ligase-1
VEILRECFTRLRPLTIKYFVKILGSNLRIGLQAKMVEEAVASAAGVPHEAVRDAVNRSGNLPTVAIAARRGTLASIEARLFHPMEFMLAKPLDRLEDLPAPETWIVEDKYDGIRAQAHVADGRVLIYTRGYDEVTASYPEVAEALRGIEGSAVLDGELLGWRVGRAIPFTVFQQRLARKRIDPALLEEIPVVFMAYDLLYRKGRLLLDAPIEERRSILAETLTGQLPLMISPEFEVKSLEEIDRQFEEARSRGNEGLVLKRRGSSYEPGRRSGTWMKVKRPYATLDVVITAAEHGSGKRATVLSDYTFGVRDGDRFLNVGKAYSGLTDEEIRELTRILRAASTDRFGRTLLVRPKVVLEVAFDSVQRSPRHKSGFALRFPRIVRWRRDKSPEDADTLDRVRELHEACLAGEPAEPKPP